jgi:hypothetical protein
MEQLGEGHRGLPFPDSRFAMKEIGMPKVVSFHSGLKPHDGPMMSNDRVKWHN